MPSGVTLQAHLWREFCRDLWQKHGGLCGICHQPVLLESMQVDHVMPRSRGGGHDLSNLQPSHPSCNARKQDGRPSKIPNTKPALLQHAAPPNSLTVEQVAACLQVEPETVRRWLRDRKLRGINLGRGRGGWRVRSEELARFIQEREH